jgi:hypothetical protein
MASFQFPDNSPNTQYKLGTGVLNGIVEVFGDSISAGVGLTTPTTECYWALLATQYGFGVNNFAVGGDGAQDMSTRVYNSHVNDGRTAIVKIGYNDVDFDGYTDANYYMFKECLMNSLLYLMLKSNQRLSGRT